MFYLFCYFFNIDRVAHIYVHIIKTRKSFAVLHIWLKRHENYVTETCYLLCYKKYGNIWVDRGHTYIESKAYSQDIKDTLKVEAKC